MRLASFAFLALMLLPVPAGATELVAASASASAEYRVGARAERAVPAAIAALVPAPLRPLLDRRGAGRRPKPGGTSMFEPSAMVPLVGARDAVEFGVGFGRAASSRERGDRERSTVVVVYVSLGL